MVCADSSFLVSCYVDDAHSIEADRRMSLADSVLVTPLNEAEVAHAIHQYVFRGKLPHAEAQRAWIAFHRDCADGALVKCDLPETVWVLSIHLAQLYGPTLGVRTLDSLHVACALELKAERFWTFDDRQARLAEAVGLDTHA
jgi:predicted nucleic acid-binding protein